MSRGRNAERGQAIVETALGILVMGAVLFAAIQFGEAGFLSLKVTEASAAALWNATGGGMQHHWPRNNPEPFDCLNTVCTNSNGVPSPALIPTQTLDVQTRYANFDGRTSAPPAARMMFVDAAGMNVTCQPNVVPLAGQGVRYSFPSGWMRNVYDDNGGVNCGSEATLNTSAMFPTAFFEAGSGGFFTTNISVMKLNNVKLCGLGRSVGGNCANTYPMMLDDWAGQNEDETAMHLILQNSVSSNLTVIVPGMRTRNSRFHDAAEKVFQASLIPGAQIPRGAGSLMGFAIVGWSPIADTWTPFAGPNENDFFLSASGEPSLFAQPRIPLGLVWPPWRAAWNMLLHARPQGFGTTPGGVPPISYQGFYGASYVMRERCFLGRTCY